MRVGIPGPFSYGVHRSSDQLQNKESSPPSPPSLGGIRFQSPPELGDLGGKNLRDETQETCVYTVAFEAGLFQTGIS